MIIEYKKHLSTEGNLVNPVWVTNGNHFPDSTSKTFIAIAPDEQDREYYIPDTVIELTKEQLINRVLSLELSRFDEGESVLLNESEVIELVDKVL